VQDAGIRPAVGRDCTRPLWCQRTAPQTLSLWRAGKLTRPHRESAREQRVAHSHRDPGCHAESQRAVSGAATSGLERSAVVAAAVGSAVVVAPAANHGLRDRLARVSRSVRGQRGRRVESQGAVRRGPRGDRSHRGWRRRARCGGVGGNEGGTLAASRRSLG
jgi:hypothetical protein